MNIANKLTVARLLAIPLFICLMLTQNFFWSGLVFILASLTDYLDGYLARKLGLVTNFGKFADPLADKMLVMTALILMVDLLHIPAWVVAVIVCRELAVTGLRLILVDEGIVLAADWSGKIKTATQMLAIICLLFADFGLTFPLGQILLYLSMVLALYSGIEYFYKNRKVFSKM